MPTRNSRRTASKAQLAKTRAQLKKTQQKIKSQQKQIRELQSSIKKLQRQGLFSSRIKDTTVINKYRKSVVKSFADILKGKAKAIKLSPKEARAFKATGERVVNNRIIKPVAPRETYYSRAGKLHHKYTDKNGRVKKSEIVNLPFNNVYDYLENLRHDPKWQKAERQGKQIAFRFYGNNSLNTFADVDSAIAQILSYIETGNGRFKNMSAEDQQELFKNIEIVSISDESKWHATTHRKQKRRRTERQRAGLANKKEKYRAKLKRTGDKQYFLVLEYDRERKRKERRTKAVRQRERDYMRRYRRTHK